MILDYPSATYKLKKLENCIIKLFGSRFSLGQDFPYLETKVFLYISEYTVSKRVWRTSERKSKSWTQTLNSFMSPLISG